jgi:hypothetical protein
VGVAVNVTGVPEQTLLNEARIDIPTVSIVSTVTGNGGEGFPVLHVSEPVTIIFPETAFMEKLTVIEFVPVPLVIVTPGGRFQI